MLRILAALTKYPGSVPSTHISYLITPLYGVHISRCTHARTRTRTHTHKCKELKSKSREMRLSISSPSLVETQEVEGKEGAGFPKSVPAMISSGDMGCGLRD